MKFILATLFFLKIIFLNAYLGGIPVRKARSFRGGRILHLKVKLEIYSSELQTSLTRSTFVILGLDSWKVDVTLYSLWKKLKVCSEMLVVPHMIMLYALFNRIW